MYDHSVMWREACITATPAIHLLQGICISYPAIQALRPSYPSSGACPLLPALSLTCRCFFSGLSGLGGRRKQETSQPLPGVPSSSCSCACGGRSKVRAARACCCLLTLYACCRDAACSDLTSATTGYVSASPLGHRWRCCAAACFALGSRPQACCRCVSLPTAAAARATAAVCVC